MTEQRVERRATTRIVLAASRLTLLGLQKVLESETYIEIVAAEHDGEAAIARMVETEPDVAILDADLRPTSGTEVAARIRRELPHVGVIILAAEEKEETLFAAIRAGAAAYLSRDCEAAELVDAVRRVRSGQFIINEHVFNRPALASKVLAEFRELSVYGTGAAKVFSPLSPREVQILDSIAQGRTNKEVAYALAISEQTVKNHMSSILRKLSVNDRTQAVVYAMRQGWIKGPEAS